MSARRRPLYDVVDYATETHIHDALSDLTGDRQFAGRLLRAIGKASNAAHHAAAESPVYRPEDAAQELFAWLMGRPAKVAKWQAAGKSTKFLTKTLTSVAKEIGRTVTASHDYRSGNRRVLTKGKSLDALAAALNDDPDTDDSIDDVIGVPRGRPLKPFKVLLPDCEYRLFEHHGYLPVLTEAYAPVAPVGDRHVWVVRPWWYRSGPHTWVCEGWVDGEYKVVTTETRLSARAINARHAAWLTLSGAERQLLLDKYASARKPVSDGQVGEWNGIHRNTVNDLIRQAEQKLIQAIVSDVTKEFALAA